MAALPKSGTPSVASEVLIATDTIPCQRATATIAPGDICALGAGGWAPTLTAAPQLRMALTTSTTGQTALTLANPRVRIRYAAPTGSAVVPGTLFYLDAGVAGGLNDTVNGAPLARALANSKGVFEGVLELL